MGTYYGYIQSNFVSDLVGNSEDRYPRGNMVIQLQNYKHIFFYFSESLRVDIWKVKILVSTMDLDLLENS